MSQKYVPQKRIRTVGAYCTVYAAVQTGLDRTVELRVLNQKIAPESAEFKRFWLECKTLASLDHPNLIKVLDIGVAQDHVFYVTDLREAHSLQQMMDAGHPFSVAEVVSIGSALAGALNHMHQRKIIHRGIAPGSVMIHDETGIVYISEFSLIKNSALADLSLEGVPHVIVGLLTPEGSLNKPLDERTDVFLLGLLLSKLLSFRAARGLQPAASEEVEAVVQRCILPDPEARFPSAPALMEALASAQDKLAEKQALARIRDAVKDRELAGRLEKEQQALSCTGEVIRKSARLRVLDTSAASRKTGKLPVAPRQVPARSRVAAAALAVLITVVAGQMWTAPREEQATPPMLAGSGAERLPPRDQDVFREAEASRSGATAGANFQQRWYLLDGWLAQLVVEKKPMPMTRDDLDAVRRLSRKDPEAAARQLDELYCRVLVATHPGSAARSR